MTCRSCGRENPAGARFCNHCGRALDPVAPSLPQRDPGSYTPRHLAEKILTTRAAVEGERKQVTVLFADVKGSMDLSESVDLEEWHGVMERFFKILTEGVHRFEGTVNQYTGDGIMALFGAPIAHEDHAARACYAALALQDDLRRYANELRLAKGINFSVRMGLNSGEVVVGKIGDDLRMDYTALGHTASLGARMEQIAEPGKAYLTEHTARLVEGMFSLGDLGKLTVKGVKVPLRVHELQGIGRLRTRLDVSRARGFSKFVGREREVAALDAALERALRGNGQVVGIAAGPGIGKSRLCLEFVERCRSRGVFVNEGHCPPHGKTVPYIPILELWRSYFGIAEKDSDDEARRKIAGTLLLFDPALHETLPILFEFLGVAAPDRPAPPMQPEAKQRRLFELLRSVVDLHTERQPALVLIDDLHWIDPASDAWVAELAEIANGRRFLLLVNFRPEYEGPWMKQPWYQQLPLLPLGPEAVEELLDDLLGPGAELQPLRQRIREHTRGNPFFVEEVVQSLTESGELDGTRGRYRLRRPIETLEIPAKVQVVLAARIDRLPEREKDLLRTAAVIGKEFAESILGSVSGLSGSELRAALAALEQAELVFAQALYPQAVYAFKHPLTHEVAYASQLSEPRARAHAAVARAIEGAEKEKLDEQAALIAHHWEVAGEALAAARWHARAAEWIGLNDYAGAYVHWQRVRALLGPAVESPEAHDLQVRSLLRLLMLGYRVPGFQEQGAALFAEGKALLERRGDLRSLAILTGLYGTIRQNAGAVTEYLELASEATRLADQAGDPTVRGAVRPDLVWALFLNGHLAESVAVADEGLGIVAGDSKLGMDLFGYSAHFALTLLPNWALMLRGRLDEAEKRLAVALRLAREHGPLESVCWSHVFQVLRAQATGEVRSALGAAQAALDAAEKAASPQAIASALMVLGIAHTLCGEWEKANDACDRCLRITREKGVWGDAEAYTLVVQGRAHLGRGDMSRAEAVANQAAALARNQGAPVFLCAANILRADVLLARDGARGADEVEAILAEAEQLIAETGAVFYLPEVHLERAALARLRGDASARERELREAHRLFTEIGAPLRAAEAATE